MLRSDREKLTTYIIINNLILLSVTNLIVVIFHHLCNGLENLKGLKHPFPIFNIFLHYKLYTLNPPLHILKN